MKIKLVSQSTNKLYQINFDGQIVEYVERYDKTGKFISCDITNAEEIDYDFDIYELLDICSEYVESLKK